MLGHKCQAFHFKKLFSRVEKIDGLWENKKILDENQRFDWIESISLISTG